MLYTLSNEFIEKARYSATAEEEKLLRYIIGIKQNEPTSSGNTTKLKLYQYVALFNEDRKKKYRAAKKALVGLSKKTYSFEDQEQVFFQSVEPVDIDETVYTVTFSEDFLRLI